MQHVNVWTSFQNAGRESLEAQGARNSAPAVSRPHL
jgi:hypothetical protein